MTAPFLMLGSAALVVGSATLTLFSASRLAVAPTMCPPGVTALPDGARTGRLLVTNQSGTATIIELESGSVVHIPISAELHGGAASPDGRWGVVADYGKRAGSQFDGNTLMVIDMAAKRVVRTFGTGEYRALHDIAFVAGSSNRVVVTAQRNQHVIEVDIERGTVLGAMDTQGISSHSLALTQDGRSLFTANEEETYVSRLDLPARQLIRKIELGTGPYGIAVTPNGREVWVGIRGALKVIDTETNTLVATLTGASFPDDVTASPDGKRVAAADAVGHKVHIADVATRRIVGAVQMDRPHSVEIHPDGRTAFATDGRGWLAVIDMDRQCVAARYDLKSDPDEVSWAPSR